MAEISIDDVEYVASLAKLNLDEETKARFAADLGSILSYFEKLGELDTSDVEPMMHVLELSNVYREDVVEPSIDRDSALRNAPKTDGEYFVVPRILDSE